MAGMGWGKSTSVRVNKNQSISKKKWPGLIYPRPFFEVRLVHVEGSSVVLTGAALRVSSFDCGRTRAGCSGKSEIAHHGNARIGRAPAREGSQNLAGPIVESASGGELLVLTLIDGDARGCKDH